MIRAIIVEDQPPAQRLLKKYIIDGGGIKLMGTFDDALSAMEYLSSNSVDLIFLDVHLPKLGGLDFLSVLSPKPYVVITTAFPEYALRGYDLDIVDYLLKPFTFERFYKSVLKVQRLMVKVGMPLTPPTQLEKTIVVKEGYQYSKIDVYDIIYIKSDGDYTYIVTRDKKYLTLNTLKHWFEQLPQDKFYKVHRSFVVNRNKIDKISGNEIFIDDIKIPIGRVFKKDFVNSYLKTRPSTSMVL